MLTGFFRMGGSIRVLGLITASLEFNMGLSYTFDEIHGACSLTVEIHLLFFSTSVDLRVERKFAGSTHAVTFKDLVPTQQDWDDYADAFVPIPAGASIN